MTEEQITTELDAALAKLDTLPDTATQGVRDRIRLIQSQLARGELDRALGVLREIPQALRNR